MFGEINSRGQGFTHSLKGRTSGFETIDSEYIVTDYTDFATPDKTSCCGRFKDTPNGSVD